VSDQETPIMTKVPVKLTFEEYLNYDDETDNRYELVDGILVSMNPASPEHVAIIRFIFLQFYFEILRLKLDWEVFNGDVGIRTTPGRSRLPDVCIMTGSDWRQLRKSKSSSAVLEDQPLVLALEVVSPGEEGHNRDYQDKPKEYARKRIPEYWIVDPIAQKISVLILVDDSYQTNIYTGQERIISPTFPELNLMVQQVLLAP
jgi:Uma2 family endonuclease